MKLVGVSCLVEIKNNNERWKAMKLGFSTRIQVESTCQALDVIALRSQYLKPKVEAVLHVVGISHLIVSVSK